MRTIDEDEVGLEESHKTLDTSKRLNQNKIQTVWECGQRTRFPTLPILGTADSETGRVVTPWRVLRGGEIHTQAPHLPRVVTPWRVLGGGEIHTQAPHLPQVITHWRVLGGGEIHTQAPHLPQVVTPWSVLGGGEIHTQAPHLPHQMCVATWEKLLS